MQDKAFFEKVIPLLAARHVYNNTLWSYGVKHDDVPAIRQFLQFANQFVSECGAWLDSPLLTIDPIVRHSYEQMDYRPLVNARVGQLGRKREILNDRFLAQYQHLLTILSYRPQLDNSERMAVIYYLLLQDRVDESLEFFSRVDPAQLATHLQYDYFAAYLDFYKSEPKLARQIAAKYAEYPVDRWREAFANIVNQADEIGKQSVKVVDKEDRTQVQTAQAASTPSFDFTVEAKQVKINYQNLKTVQVNYYQMDIELLFSRNPFVQGEAKQFSNILPNQSETIKLPAGATNFEFPLPTKLLNSNVLVEIVGAGQTQSQAYYSNALRVKVVENYGQLWVTHDKDSAPLPKVYVKVYARMKNGEVKYYKDGYTDLRGCFDYTSLNTNELDFVEQVLDSGAQRRARRLGARSEAAETVGRPCDEFLLFTAPGNKSRDLSRQETRPTTPKLGSASIQPIGRRRDRGIGRPTGSIDQPGPNKATARSACRPNHCISIARSTTATHSASPQLKTGQKSGKSNDGAAGLLFRANF